MVILLIMSTTAKLNKNNSELHLLKVLWNAVAIFVSAHVLFL